MKDIHALLQGDGKVTTVLCGLVVIIIVVVGYLRGNEKPSGSSKLKSSKSYNDVSRGLQREQQQSDESNGTDYDKVLSASQFRSFSILKVTQVSPNTKLLRFELPAGKSLGLTIGRHVSLRAEVDGAKVMRAYTPTSRIDQVGYFDLMIKSYEYGKMSSFLHSLRPGSMVDVRGPVGRFKYTKNTYPHIGLIAGGTGLTPCLQLVRTILQCPEYADDNTRFTLLFQNRCEQDILLYDELEHLRKNFKSRLQLTYFLSNAQTESFATPKSKSADVEVRGYIQQSSISSLMGPEACSLVCICGPSGFNDAMKKLLTVAGHNDESVFVW
jgi:cytochrome-b5 reductase